MTTNEEKENIFVMYKNKRIVVPFYPQSTVRALASHVSSSFSIEKDRIRFYFISTDSQKSVQLKETSLTLQQSKIRSGMTLHIRDLGRQIDKKTSLLIQFGGSILIYFLVFANPTLIYRYYNPKYVSKSYTSSQIITFIIWCIHFLKRILEVLYLHSYSRETMNVSHLLKGCAYYWSFSLLISYVICNNDFTPPRFMYQVMGILMWFLGEYCNFACHYHLSTLRDSLSQDIHPIPTEGFFLKAVCPHYAFEALAWYGFNMMTFTFIGVVFNIIGVMRMHHLARKRHNRYLAEHPSYPSNIPLMFFSILN